MNIDELYQTIILDHYREKHHSGLRDGYDAEVHHVNPSCGDELTLRVHLDGDTIADIKEGINAKAWTVGVVLGSNELGLTQEEVSSLPADELEARKADVRRRMLAAGAHYVVDTIAELPAVIAEINRKLEIL